MIKENHVIVYDPPEACFAPDMDSVCVGDEICFHDCSTGEYDQWYWDFGDGADTTGVADPCHAYDTCGVMTVELIIDGLCGADAAADGIMVCAPPVARIWADPTDGFPPLTVLFCDSSNACGCISSRVWDFGDGSDTDTSFCVYHTFELPDTYEVALSVDGYCGADTDTAFITVPATGLLCFEPDIIDTTYHCLTGETLEVDITLDDNVYPVGEIGFDVTYESSFFRFADCSNGDLTSAWPPMGCETTRAEDSISVYGYRSGADPIPADTSGSLVHLTFIMDCAGLSYGDSVPSLQCITSLAYDCSTFVSCQCREGWFLTGVVDVALEAPMELSLSENYPNPFNPGTTIQYDLPEPGGHVNLSVYDVRGRLVRTLVDQKTEPGRHEVYWDGKDDVGQLAPSGIYFYRLSTPQGVEQSKAVMLK